MAAGLIALATSVAVTTAAGTSEASPAVKHVLLLSVDGLHQSDLTWYVQQHPASALAKLLHRGVEFTNARTPFPSDSFPGMVGIATGGNPKSTGIYYDDTWNHAMFGAAYAGAAAAAYLGVPAGDARVPDVLGISQVGVVYTGKKAKIAEHGGDNPADRSVALVLSGDPIATGGKMVSTPVETTQIAPTILQLLDLDPHQLQAVQIEHTPVLPLR